MEKKTWFYIAMGCVLVSIVSLFMPVIIYRTGGTVYKFNIIDMIINHVKFNNVVSAEYTGEIYFRIDGITPTILAVLASLSVICAVIGLITLRDQRPNTFQFVMTIVGLIGVALPSIILLLVVMVYGGNYKGTISCGIAPVITPIAMALCIGVVIRRKNKIAEQIQRELEAKGLIWRATHL